MNRELGKNISVFRNVAQSKMGNLKSFFAQDLLTLPIDITLAIDQTHDGFGGGGAARAIAP